jgi:hypothetical protein
MVILDNVTRWNSTYNSIERTLKLKRRISMFYVDYRAIIGEDNLLDEDWAHLTHVLLTLNLFY